MESIPSDYWDSPRSISSVCLHELQTWSNCHQRVTLVLHLCSYVFAPLVAASLNLNFVRLFNILSIIQFHLFQSYKIHH